MPAELIMMNARVFFPNYSYHNFIKYLLRDLMPRPKALQGRRPAGPPGLELGSSHHGHTTGRHP